MALFKILSNMEDTSKQLPNSYHQGYCYFDVNTGKFWIDTTNDVSGRIAINANKADKDSDGRTFTATYGEKLAVNGFTLSLQNKAGTNISSVTIPTITYSTSQTDNVFSLIPSSGEAITYLKIDVDNNNVLQFGINI